MTSYPPLAAGSALHESQPRSTRSLKTYAKALTLGFLLIPFSDALATTYYVDSATASSTNDGLLESTPFKTLTQVNAKTFVAGDIVKFKRGGMWSGTLIPKGNGTGNTSRIVFTDYIPQNNPSATALPIINGTGGEFTVKLQNKSFFTFENFRITNKRATTADSLEGKRRGIEVLYSYTGTGSPTSTDGLIIRNNEITDVHGYTKRPTAGVNAEWNYFTAAIYVYYDGTAQVKQVKNLQIMDNYIFNARCIGIQLKPSGFMNATGNTPENSWMSGLIIKDNVLLDIGGDHILVQGALSPVIEHNAGYGAGAEEFTTPGANLWIAGMWAGYNTKNTLFQFNEVAHTATQTAYGAGDSCAFDVDWGTTGTHIFQYNYTHDNAGGVLLMMGPAPITGTDPVQYHPPAPKTIIYRYNISVNDDRRGGAGKQFPLNTAKGINDAFIYNNVIFNALPSGFRTSNTGGEHYFNNVFHTTWASYGPNVEFHNNAYVGHIPRVNDPYKVVTSDPKFVGPMPGSAASADALLTGDHTITTPNNRFKLQPGSLLINAGKNITATNAVVTNGGGDFWNYPLYASTYADIGVHELTGGQGGIQPAAVTQIDVKANQPGVLDFVGPWNFIVQIPSEFDATKPVYDKGTAAHAMPNAGAAVTCTFTGTNISIFGTRGPGAGKFRVEVNNEPDQAKWIIVDNYWANDRERQELVTITGLPAGQNKIRVVPLTKNAQSSWGGVHLDYFQISPITPPAPPSVTRVDVTTTTPSLIVPANWTLASGIEDAYYKTLLSSSAVNGTPLTYTFTGAGIRLYGPKYNSRGNLEVTLNGQTTTVCCFSPGEKEESAALLYEVTGLTPGTYTLSAKVVTKTPNSQGNIVSIDCIEVLSGGVALPVVVEPVASPATGQPWTLTYSGTPWTHSTDTTYHGSNKSVSSTSGSAMQLTFPGTRARLYVKVAANLGLLNITLNGVQVAQVNCESATTVVPYLIYETPVLPYASNHTLKATISGSGKNVGIDYFEYQP
jgi:hypothetical protein